MPRPSTIRLSVYRPPAGHNSIPKDPKDWPAMRRYKAILAAVRRGETEEEATRRYDRPKGVCSHCGAKAEKPLGTICYDCSQARRAVQSQSYYEARRVQRTGHCKLCGAAFILDRGRKYCDEHKGYVKPYVRKSRAKPDKAVKAVQFRQPPAHPKPVEPEYRVVVPESVKVVRVELPWSRWSE